MPKMQISVVASEESKADRLPEVQITLLGSTEIQMKETLCKTNQ